MKVIIYTKTGELENISKFVCPAKRKLNTRDQIKFQFGKC